MEFSETKFDRNETKVEVLQNFFFVTLVFLSTKRSDIRKTDPFGREIDVN